MQHGDGSLAPCQAAKQAHLPISQAEMRNGIPSPLPLSPLLSFSLLAACAGSAGSLSQFLAISREKGSQVVPNGNLYMQFRRTHCRTCVLYALCTQVRGGLAVLEKQIDTGELRERTRERERGTGRLVLPVALWRTAPRLFDGFGNQSPRSTLGGCVTAMRSQPSTEGEQVTWGICTSHQVRCLMA